MIAWIRRFQNSDKQTKFFVYNIILYMVLIVASTVYCYARLDYSRPLTENISK